MVTYIVSTFQCNKYLTVASVFLSHLKKKEAVEG